MLFLLGLTSLVLLVYCLLDVLATPRASVQALPKALWLLLVLPPLVGPAAWLLFGRPPRGSARQPLRRGRSAERPAPDDDDQFLRELRRRAEEQRRRAQDPRDD